MSGKDRKKGGRGLMAFISTNIAYKKDTVPAYKHVGVLSIEIKTTGYRCTIHGITMKKIH